MSKDEIEEMDKKQDGWMIPVEVAQMRHCKAHFFHIACLEDQLA